MTSDFCKIDLNSRNNFRTIEEFELNGITFRNVDVKIDTGCLHTSLPAMKFGKEKD